MARRKNSFLGGYLKTTVGLSVGASVVGALPASNVTPYVNQGFQTFGSFLPTIGTLGGAGLTMRELNYLRKQTKRFRY